MHIIIIYHDFLTTPRRSSHVKSGKTHTQSSRYTPLPIYLTPEPWFSVVAPFYSLSQPHHVTASLPSPCDNHQSTGGRFERTHCQAKGALVKLIQLHMYQRRVPLVFFSTLRNIVCKPFTILCQRDTYEANGHVCFRRSRRYKRSRHYSSGGF